MTFTQSIRTCFSKYFTFSGRATRPEYWWFFLFLILGGFVCGIFDAILFGTGTSDAVETDITAEGNGPLASVFSLATFIPGLAAGWRRMHDSGRSGLYLLYPLIAMFGLGSFIAFMGGFNDLSAGMAGGMGIVLIVSIIIIALSPFFVLFWLTRPTEAGANQYGPNPNEVTS